MNEELDYLIIKKLIDQMLENGTITKESHDLLIEKLAKKSNLESIKLLLENDLTL